MVEYQYPESTIPSSRFAFNGNISPTKAEFAALPIGAQVLLISWPDQPPVIAGMMWDEEARENYLSLMKDWDDDSLAADVALFWLDKSDDEDDITRRAMGKREGTVLEDLDSGIPVYTEQDVVEMVRTALRLQSKPF